MSQQTLAALLGLSSSPVAITFTDTEPEGVPRIAASEAAGCGYWRRAGEGQRFYTTADDHKGCAVGAHTHNVSVSPEEQKELMGMVETMVGLSYISMKDVAAMPRRETPLRFATYEPLSESLSPDVVLVRGNARQVMLLIEAAQLAGIQGSLAPMGRPTCAVVPAAINAGGTATSFGCVGNRVYTGASENDAYFSVPGEHVGALTEGLRTIVDANAALSVFHQQRAAEKEKSARAGV